MQSNKNDQSFAAVNLDQKAAKNCFGNRLKEARKKKDWSQERLAGSVGLTRVVIVNWEKGKGAPEPIKAAQLARELEQDPLEFVVLSVLQKAASAASAPLGDLLRISNELLAKCGRIPSSPKTADAYPGHLSLLDFPHQFPKPVVVVVGDRREDEPQNIGDIFVFSASPVDDRWLLSLGLPPDTQKISDKVFVTAPEEWLQERFGRTTILCIGSPATNLFARIWNECFLFRFGISRETKGIWESKRKEMNFLRTPAQLFEFYERHRADLKQTMRMFKQPGFVNFNYQHLRLVINNKHDMDFAVVSVGRNPYAKPGEPYFAILAAGAQHPGTAHAVKFLSNPTNFLEHPFGGVLEVDVPGRNHPPEEIHWYNRIENSNPDWHTVGDDRLVYTPDSLRKQLQDFWLPKVSQSQIVTDLALNEEEIKSHIELIDLLAKAKQGAKGA